MADRCWNGEVSSTLSKTLVIQLDEVTVVFVQFNSWLKSTTRLELSWIGIGLLRNPSHDSSSLVAIERMHIALAQYFSKLGLLANSNSATHRNFDTDCVWNLDFCDLP